MEGKEGGGRGEGKGRRERGGRREGEEEGGERERRGGREGGREGGGGEEEEEDIMYTSCDHRPTVFRDQKRKCGFAVHIKIPPLFKRNCSWL
jgi:hypothetical protein